MQSVFKVGGMSCQHCVDAVEKAVAAVAGDGAVAVDLSAGTVSVSGSAGDETAVKAAVEGVGFDFLGQA